MGIKDKDDGVVCARCDRCVCRSCFDDLVNRVSGNILNKRSIESLSAAGAFDEINNNRAQIFNSAENIAKFVRSSQQIATQNQGNLFSDDPDCQVKFILPKINEWNAEQKLNYEFTAVGFYLSEHPLDVYAGALARLGVVSILALTPNSIGTRPKLAGVVDSVRERTSSKGNKFAFILLSGVEGMFEVIVFSEVLANSRELIHPGKAVLITCEVRSEGDDLKLNGTKIQSLDKAVEGVSSGLIIYINNSDSLNRIKDVLDSGSAGKGKVRLILNISSDQSVEIGLPDHYLISAEMKVAIESVHGVTQLRDV